LLVFHRYASSLTADDLSRLGSNSTSVKDEDAYGEHECNWQTDVDAVEQTAQARRIAIHVMVDTP